MLQIVLIACKQMLLLGELFLCMICVQHLFLIQNVKIVIVILLVVLALLLLFCFFWTINFWHIENSIGFILYFYILLLCGLKLCWLANSHLIFVKPSVYIQLYNFSKTLFFGCSFLVWRISIITQYLKGKNTFKVILLCF